MQVVYAGEMNAAIDRLITAASNRLKEHWDEAFAEPKAEPGAAIAPEMRRLEELMALRNYHSTWTGPAWPGESRCPICQDYGRKILDLINRRIPTYIFKLGELESTYSDSTVADS